MLNVFVKFAVFATGVGIGYFTVRQWRKRKALAVSPEAMAVPEAPISQEIDVLSLLAGGESGVLAKANELGVANGLADGSMEAMSYGMSILFKQLGSSMPGFSTN